MNLRRRRRKWRGVAMHGLVLVACAVLGIGASAAATDPPDTSRTIELRIVGRRVEGGPETIRLARGEKAILRLTSDEPMTVHVHGYDIERRLIPQTAATLALEARFVGRFPVTAHIDERSAGKASAQQHHRERTLLYLEVLPE